MTTSEFGRRVAALRTEMRMTQEQLAKAAGVSEKTVYNVEAGIAPRPSTMSKLMDALGLDEFKPAGASRGSGFSDDLSRLETAALALLRVADAESVRSVAIGMVDELDRDQLEGLITDLSVIMSLEPEDLTVEEGEALLGDDPFESKVDSSADLANREGGVE